MMKLIAVSLLLVLSIQHASAQVSDFFADGNFTSNPSWVGDDSLFEVTNSQLRLKGSVSSDASIVTAHALTDSVTWTFFTRIALSPSTQNFSRFYVMSNSANLEGPLNGYYIQLGGVTGNTDSITLYKQAGNLRTRIIAGRPGTVSKSNNLIRVKVFRSPTGGWELYSDTLGGNNFVLEGTGIDNEFTTCSYLGWTVKYTSGNSQNHYLDDVTANQPIVDLQAPVVDSVSIKDNNSLWVYFNEPIKQSSAQTLLNYLVSSPIGNPVSATLEGGNRVLLTFSTSFTSKNQYTITIKNVTDSAGNTMADFNTSFLYFVPQALDLLISELMPDPTPSVGLPELEFIELYNNAGVPVNLAGFSLSDGGALAILPAVTIMPDSFVIVCATSSQSNFSAFGLAVGISNFPSLNNTGDKIILRDNTGKTIHEINYNLSWYNDADKGDGGYTIELQLPKQICKEGQAYAASTNNAGGTPGAISSAWNSQPDNVAPLINTINVVDATNLQLVFNERMNIASLLGATVSLQPSIPIASTLNLDADTLQVLLQSPLLNGTAYTLTISGARDCSGNLLTGNPYSFSFYTPQPLDVLISEFFPDPSPTIGLPEKEFIELYNKTNIPINLSGFTISDGTAPIALPNTTIDADGFVIVCLQNDTSLFKPFGKVAPVKSFPSLNNTSDNIVLRDKKGNIIHQLTFDLSWYDNPDKEDGGYSIELQLPRQTCKGKKAYAASNDVNGGTPGVKNSLWDLSTDATAPFVNSSSAKDAATMQLVFNENMNAQSLSNATIIIQPTIAISSTEQLGTDTFLIYLQSAMTNKTTYTVSLQNVADCSNNFTTLQTSIDYYTPETARNYDVLIHEIMADPEPQQLLPNAEYIELYNRSNRVINLKNWQLGDISSMAVLPDVLILPDSFKLFCSTANAPLFNGKAVGVAKFPSIGNEEEMLVLKNDSGQIIHSVNYSSALIEDGLKRDGGWSAEMIDPNNPCETRNWLGSKDKNGGTPGKTNSVKGVNPDKTTPRLIRSYLVDSNRVQLFFNEPLDSSSFSVSRFLLNNTVAPSSLSGNLFNYQSTTLTFDTLFAKNTIYSITVDSVADCAGNLISDYKQVDLGVPTAADSTDLVINEVLFNPKSGGVDFIELYNKGNNIVDLNAFIIAGRDENGTITDPKYIAPEGFVIKPAEYPVVTSNTSVVANQYFCFNPNVLVQSALPSMADDKGTIVLLNKAGKIVDEFSYTNDLHLAILDDEDGVSLERIDYNRPTNDASNWTSAAAAAGYATPTAKNSQYLQTNGANATFELQPSTISPDGDGYQDVMNVHYKLKQSGYTGNLWIYDANGRVIKQLFKNEVLGTTGTYTWDGVMENGTKAPIGIYVFYLEVFTLNGDVSGYKAVAVVAGKL